jgi:hypothetical protein
LQNRLPYRDFESDIAKFKQYYEKLVSDINSGKFDEERIALLIGQLNLVDQDFKNIAFVGKMKNVEPLIVKSVIREKFDKFDEIEFGKPTTFQEVPEQISQEEGTGASKESQEIPEAPPV